VLEIAGGLGCLGFGWGTGTEEEIERLTWMCSPQPELERSVRNPAAGGARWPAARASSGDDTPTANSRWDAVQWLWLGIADLLVTT
jgi:hypothetical protein